MALEAELKQPQHQLAVVDLTAQPRANRRSDTLEHLLLKLRELKIKMYQETGHHLPHVHVDYGRRNHAASYSINERRRLAGTLDAKYDREILDWIEANRDKLLEAWHTLQSGEDHRIVIGELASNA